MVGDRSFDIIAAHAHGLPAIGVTWGIGTREELRDAGADAIIDRPDELPATAAVLLGRLMSAPVLADFNLYSISLWLHISAAVVGLGATFALAVGFPLALRLGPALPAVRAPPEPGGHPQARLAGAAAADRHRHLSGRRRATSMGEPWISITFVIAIVLGGLQGAYFVPTDRSSPRWPRRSSPTARRRCRTTTSARRSARAAIGAARRPPDHPRRLPDGHEAGRLARRRARGARAR